MSTLLGPSLRQFAGVYGVRILAAGMAFFASVIVARYLGPERFGVFAVLLIVFRVLSDIVGPGLDTAIVRFCSRAYGDGLDAARPYFRVLVNAKLAVVLVLVVGGVVFAPLLNAQLLPNAAVPDYAVTLAVWGAAFAVVWSTAQAYFQSRQRFSLYALFEGLHAALRLAAFGGIALTGMAAGAMAMDGFTPYGVSGLIAAQFGVTALVAVIAITLVPRRLYFGQAGQHVRGEVYHFSKWLVVACGATALSQGMDVFILGYLGAPEGDIGKYRAAVQLIMAGELAVVTLFQVLLPKASQLKTAGELGDFLRLYQGRSLLFGMLFLLAIPIGVPAITIIYGQAYAEAGQLFAILIVGTAFIVSSAPAGAVVYSAGQSHVIALLETLKVIAIVAAGVWAAQRYGAYGMAVTVAAVRSVVAVLTYVVARRAVRALGR